MDTVIKTAAGILLAGAISGFVWLGVAYPAAFVNLLDLAKSKILPLVSIVLAFAGLTYALGAYGLARSVVDEEELSNEMKDEAKRVRTFASWFIKALLFLVGVSIYIAIVRTISEAVHPDFYGGL